jgi:hypothetical protein
MKIETRTAERKRLAGEAMFLITLERSGHDYCRTTEPSAVALEKIAR